MEILRTPDDRFENLPGYPFDPHYVDVPDSEGGQLRIHYVDEGPGDAAPVVLFHGEPTWSYLYRKMIPVLVGAGHRVLAPDLAGFGKSDKPAKKTDYTVARHVEWMRSWLLKLDLHNITFFGQDWGSLIGLTLCALEQNRVDRIMMANGGLPDPRNIDRMVKAATTGSPEPGAFTRWQTWIEKQEKLETGKVISGEIPELAWEGMSTLSLSDEEKAAYDAPFPDGTYQAGALIFPLLAPSGPEDADTIRLFSEAWEVFDRWEKPFLTAYGKADPILGWFDKIFQEHVPGAKGQPHTEFPDGVHFIQEQYGPELARIMNDFMAEDVSIQT
ncbi:MAG: haloalkane dehalogenase [Deltaproteobacteria bacterium]|nr:haloalkane dehalogenase [Deltaproteobacteria bacterium]